MRRIQLQLLFVLIAAISVSTLSVILIASAVGRAERYVVADTHNVLNAALAELNQQYRYRTESDSSWEALPVAAQDVSLRGISQTVFRSYPGVEGGFFTRDTILGYSYPTHGSGGPKLEVPKAERPEIRAAIDQSLNAGHASRVLRGARDLVVIQAVADDGHVCWP